MRYQPPLAQQHDELLDDGLVRITPKRSTTAAAEVEVENQGMERA